MSIQVRERPPLRLSVKVETPSGARKRWAVDDPDPRNVPNALSFSDAMPGGFESLTCTLERDPRRSYPDLEPLSKVTVASPGGTVAWQGRLDAVPDTSGDEAQAQPSASGYQSHLQDRPAAMIYFDQSLSNFVDPPLTRQIDLVNANEQQASYSVGWDPKNDLPALVEESDDSWTSPWTPTTEAWYDSGFAGPIAKVIWTLRNVDHGSNWTARIRMCDDPSSPAVEDSGNLEGGAGAGTFTPSQARRYVTLRYHNTVTAGGQDGQKNIAYWTAIVVGNHGLNTNSGAGVWDTDVIAHAVSAWCPLIGFSDESIGPGQFIIPQLTFPDMTNASEIIQQAASYSLLDWAVWEGPLMWANARGAVGRKWRARSGPAQLQNAGATAARLYNGVIVSFTSVGGNTVTVGPPGSGCMFEDAVMVDPDPDNPANQVIDPQRGSVVPKWMPLSMSGTGTVSAAKQVGADYLQAQKDMDTSGQAQFSGYVQDDMGVWFPAWMMRSGDQVSFVDAHDASYRRVVSKSYDDSSKQCSVQLDQPPDTMTALLERLSVVLAPAGLS